MARGKKFARVRRERKGTGKDKPGDSFVVEVWALDHAWDHEVNAYVTVERMMGSDPQYTRQTANDLAQRLNAAWAWHLGERDA